MAVGHFSASPTITTGGAGTAPAVLSTKLRYVDMNASTGGVARDTLISTTYTTIYQYSGSGIIIGWNVTLDDVKNWSMKFIVDSEQIFAESWGLSLNDMHASAVYNFDAAGSRDPKHAGLEINDNSFFYETIYPIEYVTSIEIQAARNAGQGDKAFLAGLMILTKET